MSTFTEYEEIAPSFSEPEQVDVQPVPEVIAIEDSAAVALDRSLKYGEGAREIYGASMADYENSGSSRIVEQHKAELASEDTSIAKEALAANLVGGNIVSLEQAQSAFFASPKRTVVDAAVESASLAVSPDTATAEDVMGYLFATSGTYKSSKRELQEFLYPVVNVKDTRGWGVLLADGALEILRTFAPVPLGADKVLVGIAEDLSGRSHSLTHTADIVRTIRKHVQQLDGSQKLEFAKLIKRRLEEKAAFVGRNFVSEAFAMDAIFLRDMIDDPTEAEVAAGADEAIREVGDILTIALLPAFGAAVVKMALLPRLAKSAPVVHSKIASDIIANADAEGARAVGRNVIDVVDEAMIPVDKAGRLNKMGGDVAAQFEELPASKSVDAAFDDALFQERVLDKIQVPSARVQMSRVTNDDGTAVVNVTYGFDDAVGFRSVEEASAKAAELFGEGVVTRVLVKAGDELVEASSGLLEVAKMATRPAAVRNLPESLKADALAKATKAVDDLKQSAVKAEQEFVAQLKADEQMLVERLKGATGDRGTPRYKELVNDLHAIRQEIPRAEARVEKLANKAETKAGLARAYNEYANEALSQAQKMWDETRAGGQLNLQIREAFFQVEKKAVKDVDEKVADELVFGPDSVLVSGGRWLEYVMSPASRLASWIVSSGSAAIDRAAGLRHYLASFIKDDFAEGLNKKSQHRVAQILQEGDSLGKTFSVDELKGKGLTQKEIKGYFSVRKMFDEAHLINDTVLKEKYARNGYKMIDFGGDQYTYGKLLSPNEASRVEWVFDYASKSIVRMDMSNTHKTGYSVVKLHRTERVGNRAASHALIKNDAVKISELPARVLPYREGYLTKVYDDDYFVVVNHKVIVDGKERLVQKALGTASTKWEASRLATKLADEGGGDITVRYAREMGAEDLEKFSGDLDFQTTGAIFGRRGEHLKSSTGRAGVLDPAQAIMRAISITSTKNSIGEWAGMMRERWMNTYGHLSGGVYPERRVDIRSADLRDAKQVSDARSLWEYTRTVASSRDDIDTRWRQMAVSFAEWIEGNGNSYARNLAGAAARRVGETSPFASVNSVAFKAFIVANPIRQMLLQSSQILMLSGLSPKTFLKSARDVMALKLSRIDNTAPLAKSLGITDTQAKELMHQLDFETGIRYAAESHTFVSDNFNELTRYIGGVKPIQGEQPWLQALRGAASTAVRTTAEYANKPLNAMRRIGFAKGEQFNMENTFMFALNRHREKYGWPKSQAEWDTIAGDTRQLSLTMNNAGQLAYQRGMLKTFTQFLSVQHKAMEVMLRGLPLANTHKLGNKFFTPQEARRIALGQMVLWGSTGVGVSTIYESIRDHFGLSENEATRVIVSEGLLEHIINEGIGALTGKEENLDVSGFAPAGGMYDTVVTLMKSFLGGEKTIWETIPAGSAIGRISDAINLTGQVFARSDLSTPEKVVRSINEFGKIASGYNQAVRAFAYNRYGKIVNSLGDPVADATFADAVARGLFGIPNEVESDYRKLTQAFYGSSGKKREDNARSVAKDWYNNVKKQVRMSGLGAERAGDSMHSSYINIVREVIATQRTVLDVFEPEDAYIITNEMSSLLLKDHETNKMDSLIEMMAMAVLDGSVGSSMDYMLSRILNSRTVPEEDKAMMKSIVEELQDSFDLYKQEATR